MNKSKFASWPSFTEEEANAVSKVLLSNKVNYWTGNECHQFENEFADWINVEHAVTVMNGTVALDVALKVLGIGSGDEVIVTSRSFFASVSSIVNVGATPVFADVDSESQNITAQTISKVLTEKTKVIVVVHLAGWPCDMDTIIELAAKYNLRVIEDCAQAHGAKYKGKSVGTFGDIAAWSFCQDKIMTTGGEGGMITTNSETLWQKAWSYKDHGKSMAAVNSSNDRPGFRWLHDSFGTNYRMTEMQASIGRIQLTRMNKWHASRSDNANNIMKACRQFPKALRVVALPSEIIHAWYKYYVFVIPDGLKSDWNRDRIVTEINSKGVPCYTGSCSEIYLEKAFDESVYRPSGRLPVARELGETSLMFLVHPTLSSNDLLLTCNTILQVMELASLS